MNPPVNSLRLPLGKEIVGSFLVGLCLFLQSGCAVVLLTGGAAAGAGAVAYVRGELTSTEAADLDKVWAATLAAMGDLEFAVTAREKDALSGRVIARGAGDKKTQVDLKRLGDRQTELRIRVGLLGDETLSRQVLDKIRKRL